MIKFLKKIVRKFSLKKRFSHSVIYDSVYVDNDSYLNRNSVLFNNVTVIRSNIGKSTYIQKNSVLNHCEIGAYCCIASDVQIGLASHPLGMVSTSPIFYDSSQPLPFFFSEEKYDVDISPKSFIGSDVWVGQGALIKSGVTIGTGAVIAAGAVVTSDVAAYSIVGGVPAKHIKWRFDESIRIRLLKSQWWELGDDRLKALCLLFKEPDAFLMAIEKK